MQIYTSYYKKIEKQGPRYALVQVSNSKPSWFPWDVMELKEVYPKWKLVSGFRNGEISSQEFTEQYMQQLNRLDKDAVLDKLSYYSENTDNKDIVLLCYEKNGFCHRHVLAKWLDVNVEELDF